MATYLPPFEPEPKRLRLTTLRTLPVPACPYLNRLGRKQIGCKHSGSAGVNTRRSGGSLHSQLLIRGVGGTVAPHLSHRRRRAPPSRRAVRAGRTRSEASPLWRLSGNTRGNRVFPLCLGRRPPRNIRAFIDRRAPGSLRGANAGRGVRVRPLAGACAWGLRARRSMGSHRRLSGCGRKGRVKRWESSRWRG